ncbi:DegT/DnrJ/EryC1/StrS family aminotransferase [Paenibacillus flagellatus]|uniref:Pyridoxal phosphate-dependent aminotransferase n=1 Tax=Paenibacillus flagellatus TaxID=2211139 RepID=A0A2V5KP57_9BACL|nr:aminotransferase class I/II-fold pyridoxal phosphate-dependent enzyme [Paenibacillus flagellatus]PYI57190.1 pyridoxal phosphate-dependent aminotransferase [Paenibacillus flagellatus]
MSLLPKKVYLSPPHIGDLEVEYVKEAFSTNWVAPLGPHVDAFEREMAEYVGTKGAVALSSGTAALHMALKVLGVGTGDTVFCSTLTFVASANPILYLQALPVFIDSEPGTWNMSPQALERALSESVKTGRLPKAVIVVNLYGQSAEMDPITKLCKAYGIPLIEDAAESLGASYKGRSSGSFGDFGVFSFNGNKIITTSGGGMLVSDDTASLEKVRHWSTQARDPARHYEHSEVGYNYRLSNVLAAIGRGQLQTLEERVASRRQIFEKYKARFGDHPGIKFMPEAPNGRSNRWLTVMTIDPTLCGISAADCVDRLAQDNIEARPVWKPMHLQPLFRGYEYFAHSEQTSVSDDLFANGICLPSGTNMSDDDLERVFSSLDGCLKRAVNL